MNLRAAEEPPKVLKASLWTTPCPFEGSGGAELNFLNKGSVVGYDFLAHRKSCCRTAYLSEAARSMSGWIHTVLREPGLKKRGLVSTLTVILNIITLLVNLELALDLQVEHWETPCHFEQRRVGTTSNGPADLSPLFYCNSPTHQTSTNRIKEGYFNRDLRLLRFKGIWVDIGRLRAAFSQA